MARRVFQYVAICRPCMVRFCWDGAPGLLDALCRHCKAHLTPQPKSRSGFPDWYIKPKSVQFAPGQLEALEARLDRDIREFDEVRKVLTHRRSVMFKYPFTFCVTVKVKAESEKQAAKVAKQLRNVALQAVKSDGRSTAKASPVELTVE